MEQISCRRAPTGDHTISQQGFSPLYSQGGSPFRHMWILETKEQFLERADHFIQKINNSADLCKGQGFILPLFRSHLERSWVMPKEIFIFGRFGFVFRQWTAETMDLLFKRFLLEYLPRHLLIFKPFLRWRPLNGSFKQKLKKGLRGITYKILSENFKGSKLRDFECKGRKKVLSGGLWRILVYTKEPGGASEKDNDSLKSDEASDTDQIENVQLSSTGSSEAPASDSEDGFPEDLCEDRKPKMKHKNKHACCVDCIIVVNTTNIKGFCSCDSSLDELSSLSAGEHGCLTVVSYTGCGTGVSREARFARLSHSTSKDPREERSHVFTNKRQAAKAATCISVNADSSRTCRQSAFKKYEENGFAVNKFTRDHRSKRETKVDVQNLPCTITDLVYQINYVDGTIVIFTGDNDMLKQYANARR